MGTQGVSLNSWIPACAGMTGRLTRRGTFRLLDSRVRGNDGTLLTV